MSATRGRRLSGARSRLARAREGVTDRCALVVKCCVCCSRNSVCVSRTGNIRPLNDTYLVPEAPQREPRSARVPPSGAP
eukprot:1541795-Prymnesium_polylepis.1